MALFKGGFVFSQSQRGPALLEALKVATVASATDLVALEAGTVHRRVIGRWTTAAPRESVEVAGAVFGRTRALVFDSGEGRVPR